MDPDNEMKEYRELRENCIYRNNKWCTYWSEKTQCHFLSCPVFSPTASKEEKDTIKKHIYESIIFNENDLDKDRTTTHDLIKSVRNDILSFYQDKRDYKNAITVQQGIQRMICFVCEEPINDDKFSIIRDPNDVLIYIHSKGKCKIRKNGIQKVRKEWLEKYTKDDEY
ncbi:MAG: hypothetical protein ACFFAU_04835 [Candidatus Hodarchaeota archaeon]